MKECPHCNRCYEDSPRCCPHDGQALVETLPGGCLIDSKYHLDICIGRGGMGAVYRATHVHLRRLFAIKTILPEFASRDPKAADRFIQEARAAAAIQHPNVVAITDFGITSSGLFYYVMEHIEGTTLRDELHLKGAMSPERIYRIFKQVIAGVASAHRLHMVHRDLKPSNIMLTRLPSNTDSPVIIPINEEQSDANENELAKVVDFGLARFVNDSFARRSELSDSGLVGSPLYMSPEQCDGAPVDERSDIYSLGVILYHMLTGEVPFKGDSLASLLTGHLLKEPPSMRALRPDIPDKVERMVMKALAKKPELRQQSAAELADEFEAAMTYYLSPDSSTVTLTVQTVPPACEVYIDDEYRGRTSVQGRLVVKGLAAGNHSARITLNGYLEWAQNFTAPVGEYRLVAELQRKEDLAFAAGPRASAQLVNPVQRNSGTLQRSSRPLPRYEGSVEPANYRGPVQQVKFSFVDLMLAIIAVTATVVLFAAWSPIDPISAMLAEASNLPVEGLVSVLGVISIIGLNTSIIMADQIAEYRNSNFMSSLFNLSSLLFVLLIIIPLAVAVPMRIFSDQSATLPVLWFVTRLVVITCCFSVQQRIRSRRRVPFLY